MHFFFIGLLRGHPLPHRDGCPSAASAADSSMVSESHLPAGLCTEGPGSHESQVRLTAPFPYEIIQILQLFHMKYFWCQTLNV